MPKLINNENSLSDFISNIKTKKIVIWGLGLNFGGLEAAKFFAKIRGTEIIILDSKSPKELKESIESLNKFKNIKFILGRAQEEKDFEGAEIIIKNHAIYWEAPLVKKLQKKGYRIETDVTLFFKFFKGVIVGITGSKGKTTTTSLIGKLLKKGKKEVLLGGNIRVSLFSFLTKKILENKKKVAVLELSSFQLEDLNYVKRSPEVAVITNILRDHLNRYGTINKYFLAKKNIYIFQKKDGFLVLNESDRRLKKLEGKTNSKIIYSKEDTNKNIQLKNAFFKHPHNKQSLNLALTVALNIFKIDRGVIIKELEIFNGIKYRLEKIAKIKGVSFYNDTTATIPDATIGNLKTFKDKVILISGGSDKNLKFEKFGKVVAKRVKKIILLPGNITQVIRKNVLKNNPSLPCKEVKNMREGVLEAFKGAKEGDVIILSPGCTSFGLFMNEFDRGDQFNKVVKSLLRSK